MLCVTGGEALYADMGHFGRRPIRVAWYAVGLPVAAAQLLRAGRGRCSRTATAGRRTRSTRWRPAGLLYPLVVLATAATVIASQALISGAFSLTQQAVQLGYLPRVTIVHTSGEAEGQIYVPEINYALMVACVALVLGFRSSANLAAAYGIAVTGTMTITIDALLRASRASVWGWSCRQGRLACRRSSWSSTSRFFAREHGQDRARRLGAAGDRRASLFTVMTTWKRGRRALGSAIAGDDAAARRCSSTSLELTEAAPRARARRSS